MFTLHDRIRRFVCRAIFLAGCVLPTLAVLAWAATHHVPGRTAALEQELSDRLGWRVTLEGVANPRPRVTVFQGLTAAQPETGEPLVRMSQLEVTRLPDRLELVARQAKVEPEAVGQLWQLLAHRLRTDRQCEIRLTADGAMLGGSQSEELGDLETRIEPAEAGAQATLVVSRSDAPKPIRLRVLRNRQTTPPTTAWELDTTAASLPTALVSAVLPARLSFGQASRFRGSIWASQTGEGWIGNISGELSDVELQSLLAERLPYKLSGTAQLVIERARFRHGRLEEVAGSVTAGPGQISRALVVAAVDSLGMAAGLRLDSLEEVTDYEQLNLALRLDSRGLAIRGTCPGPTSGRTLVARWGTMLGEPAEPVQPVTGLMQMLAPASTIAGGAMFVPWTLETEQLTRVLPVPDSPVRHALRTPIQPPQQPAVEPPPGQRNIEPEALMRERIHRGRN